MGYLKDKYGTAEQLQAATSKWIKFTVEGQQHVGTVDGFQEGKYGTEIIFADGKLLTLNNSMLLAEVVKADPAKGDQLRITYMGDEPLPEGEQRSPTKLYRVEIARAAPVEFEAPAPSSPPLPDAWKGTEADEPF